MSTQIDQFVDYWSTKRISPEEKNALWSNIPVLRQMRHIIVNQFGGVYNLSNLDNAFSQVRDQLFPSASATPVVSAEEVANNRLESERQRAKEDRIRNVNAHEYNSSVSSLVEDAKAVQKKVDESTQIAARQAADQIVNESAIYRNGRPVHAATAELKKGLAGIFAYHDHTKSIDWVETVALRRRFLKAEQDAQNNNRRQTW